MHSIANDTSIKLKINQRAGAGSCSQILTNSVEFQVKVSRSSIDWLLKKIVYFLLSLSVGTVCMSDFIVRVDIIEREVPHVLFK